MFLPQEVGDIDFRTTYFKITNKLLLIRLSEYVAKRKTEAMKLAFGVASYSLACNDVAFILGLWGF